MSVTLTPNPAVPGSTVTVEGAGFTPKLKTRIKDAGDVWRSRADGGFSVGLVVSTTPKTQTVVVQQQISGAWVTSWSGTVTVQASAPPPPPPTPTKPPILVAPGGIGITVTTHDRVIDGETITGPQSDVYRAFERGIQAIGTAANPIRNLTIRNCTLRNLGDRAIHLQHVTNLVIEDCVIEDCVYAGILVLSCIGGRISRNTVRRIGVKGAAANSNNAYGIGATANPGDPMSQDVLVELNVVEDVPTWEAMDTHGGLRITFDRNIVRRSRRGVMLTTNGAAATDCKVTANQFLAPVSIPAGQQYAVAPVNAVNATITGNTITGWGAGRDMLRTYPNPGLVYTGNVVTP